MTIIIVIAVIVLFILWRFQQGRGIHSISTEQLKEIINDRDKLFIDVRTKAEYKNRSLRQFKNMPLGSDFTALNKDKEIVVICQSGMRSSKACKQLKKLGYNKVTNVRGGMSSY